MAAAERIPTNRLATGPAPARRRFTAVLPYLVLLVLFAPQLIEQLPVDARPLRVVGQIGAVLLASYLAVGYWFLTRLRLRAHVLTLVCLAVFGLSVVPYLFVSLRQIHPTYLGSLLQHTAYPLLLGVFLPSALSARQIIRATCVILIAQGLSTTVFAMAGLAHGRFLFLSPIAPNAETDANALALGVIAIATMLLLNARGPVAGRPRPWRRRAWIAVAVVFSLLAVTTIARAALGALLASLLLLVLVRYLGKRVAAHGTQLVIIGCAGLPLVVAMGLVAPEDFRGAGSVIVRKRVAEYRFGSTLVRRAYLWRTFTSRLSWADAVGTRPALHEYDYYHDRGVKRTVETPHNYWVSMILTVGYLGVLTLLALWLYSVYLIRRARDPALQWMLAWLVYFAVQGVTGRGPFMGLMALVFWCVISAALAAVPGFSMTLGSRGPAPAGAGLHRAQPTIGLAGKPGTN